MMIHPLGGEPAGLTPNRRPQSFARINSAAASLNFERGLYEQSISTDARRIQPERD